VPEGIIFQSQNAYKALRRMLVENYLWAVVSLPAGVFNPYSGVKTSILFFDRNLVKRADAVLFVKIQNDGFDLGAQRREIEGDELPDALKTIEAWKQNQKAPQDEIGLAVSRKRLLESPDITLSSDRYRPAVVRAAGKCPMVQIGDLLEPVKYTPKVQKKDFLPRGRFPIVDQSEGFIAGYWNDEEAVFHAATPVVLFGDHTRAVKYVDFDFVLGADGVKILKPNGRASPKYLYYCLRHAQVPSLGYSRHFKELVRLEIPVPPLSEQEGLVAELDGYRKVIEAARQIVANYKPNISVDPKWPTAELGSIADFKNGINYSKESKGTGIKVIGVSNFKDNLIAPTNGLDEINPKGIVSKDNVLQDGDILFVRSNGNRELVGRNLLVQTNNERLTHSAFTIRLRLTGKNVLPMFYALLFKNPIYHAQLMGRGANINNLSQDILSGMVVPLPPLPEQRSIVAEIEAERSLVDSNRELIARFEKKMQARLAEIWGD
jgi:type I restriction enzyme M protein